MKFKVTIKQPEGNVAPVRENQRIVIIEAKDDCNNPSLVLHEVRHSMIENQKVEYVEFEFDAATLMRLMAFQIECLEQRLDEAKWQ